MRVDIPYQMFVFLYAKEPFNKEPFKKASSYYKYSITDIYYISFTKDFEWYSFKDGSIVCLFGPCRYDRQSGYWFSVGWIDRYITKREWLIEIEKVLERMR